MADLIVDDSFVGETNEYDLTLIVENHKIRVSKVVLCLASPVFRAMLKSEFKEKDQTEVELPGKKHQDFVEFLSCIYPGKMEEVTSDSVYRVVPLAIEYQVKVLENRCHKLLIEHVKTKHLTDATQIYRHIQLAELYKLEGLRKACISVASDFTLSELDTAASEYPIPEQILVQVHHLARRKQELNKMDDEHIKESTRYVNNTNYEKSLQGKTNVSVHTRSDDKLRAARIWYRYFQDNEEILEKVIKSMRGMKVSEDEDISMKYELLPETLKQKLDVDFGQD